MLQPLFGRHRVPLYRWLLRLVGGEALAEDLLSEVFLDVWRQAAAFEARSSVSTWLLSIARYKALSARRRRTDVELDEKIGSRVADPADDPEVVLQKKTRAELLRHSLARLSPEHGEVIDLVRDKMLLGYHDIRLGNQPDARLTKFVTINLPKIAPKAREKFEAHKDLLAAYASGEMQYEQFAARVLRRSRGENEDGEFGVDPADWPEF